MNAQTGRPMIHIDTSYTSYSHPYVCVVEFPIRTTQHTIGAEASDLWIGNEIVSE